MNIKSLVPWNRSRTPTSVAPIFGLQDEINRMFDDMWRGFGPPSAGRSAAPTAFAASPAVAVDETEKAIAVSVELPGLTEKDIEMSLDGDTLTVRGEKREEKSDKKTGYSERWFGSFERTVALPPGLVAEKADAKFKEGVLTVTVPKSEQLQTKAKKISITKL